MMRRYSLSPIRLLLAIAATLVASLAVVAGAQAVVVNDRRAGHHRLASRPPGTRGSRARPTVTPGVRMRPIPRSRWIFGGPTMPVSPSATTVAPSGFTRTRPLP